MPRAESQPVTPPTLACLDLGTLPYAEALHQQREINLAVSRHERDPALLLVEHPPVITVSGRRGSADHLLASPDRLAALGIGLEETDRGGDITYHGPGQLVAYPILRLGELGLNLGRYMRWLEQIVIDTVGVFGVQAFTEQGATGVWVQREASPPAKLCAMGVRVRKNTTMHGLALNVATDLSHFDTIVPCGLHGREVTSLDALLGAEAPSMAAVKRALTERFTDAIQRIRVA